MTEKKKAGGLAGVVAGQTALCTVGKEGAGLTYRGYDIYALADNGRVDDLGVLFLCQRHSLTLPPARAPVGRDA